MCEKLCEYLVESFISGFDVVTLYLSSVQNFSRSNADIEAGCFSEHIMYLDLLPDIANRFQAKVINAGNLEILPLYLKNSAEKLSDDTKENEKRKIYLCIAYNPFEEVLYAYGKYRNTGDIMQNLWVSDYVDLLIRTGKGQIMSSLLPLQCAGHAKMYVIDELFLDTNMNHIKNIIDDYLNPKNKKIQSVDDLIL